MNDLEKLKELLDGWHAPYEEEGIKAEPQDDLLLLPPQEAYISVRTSGSGDVGYSGFIVEFQFTSQGKFTGMGAWE